LRRILGRKWKVLIEESVHGMKTESELLVKEMEGNESH
jgi:hypothetical protein